LDDLPSHKWLGYFQQKYFPQRNFSFCGCGTTIHAAQKLGCQWLGIDVTCLAIKLIKRRLKDASGGDAQFAKAGKETIAGKHLPGKQAGLV
jgi:adenine specific DNA methylase Mod